MSKFNEMNAEWDAWVSPGNTPARATVEAKLANPKYNVEIMVVAARYLNVIPDCYERERWLARITIRFLHDALRTTT